MSGRQTASGEVWNLKRGHVRHLLEDTQGVGFTAPKEREIYSEMGQDDARLRETGVVKTGAYLLFSQ